MGEGGASLSEAEGRESCAWVSMLTSSHPALPAPAELTVRLIGAQGERVIWTARGHQSWTWMNQTLLVTSPVEFQVF